MCCSGVQSHLALCCKATLPIMCMGRVTVNIYDDDCERPLLQAAHCLTKYPADVSHLEVSSRIDVVYCLHSHRLVDLRCAHALLCLTTCAALCVCMLLLLLCHSNDSTQDGD